MHGQIQTTETQSTEWTYNSEHSIGPHGTLQECLRESGAYFINMNRAECGVIAEDHEPCDIPIKGFQTLRILMLLA